MVGCSLFQDTLSCSVRPSASAWLIFMHFTAFHPFRNLTAASPGLVIFPRPLAAQASGGCVPEHFSAFSPQGLLVLVVVTLCLGPFQPLVAEE